jgi:hypothetical protein
MSKTQEQIDRATMGCVIRAITDWTPRSERLAKLDAKAAR